MKKLIIITVVLLLSATGFAQNIGINNTGAAPDNSALLDLSAPDKGFLITRADTGNISAPAFGLMTLAPADSCLYLYNGNRWVGIGGGGTDCSCNCAALTPPQTSSCNEDINTAVVEVTNPITGETWMDRNLGASQVATSSTDVDAYGDLYQWGRCNDGHEDRTSPITTTLSSGDTPGHSDFINTVNSGVLGDWRNPQNDNLWQGVSGTNNPCPSGYRLPTAAEWEAERTSWSSNNTAGAFASPLKLTLAGRRTKSGSLSNVGTYGRYWSSTVVTSSFGTGEQRALRMLFYSSHAHVLTAETFRGDGSSVRCIKD